MILVKHLNKLPKLLMKHCNKDQDMKSDIKERWIAALESDKYKQTKSMLVNSYGHCCLGVLCELAVEDGIIEKIEEQEVDIIYDDDDFEVDEKLVFDFDGNPVMNYSFDHENEVLPKKVQEWAGLNNCDPLLYSEEFGTDSVKEVRCSTANDELKKSFKEIAQLIRDNL